MLLWEKNHPLRQAASHRPIADYFPMTARPQVFNSVQSPDFFNSGQMLLSICPLTLRSHADSADGGVFAGSRESSQSYSVSGRCASLHRLHTQSPLQEQEEKRRLSCRGGGEEIREVRLEETLRGKAEKRGHVAGQVEDLGAAITAQQLASDRADGAEVLALHLLTVLLDHAHPGPLLLHARVCAGSLCLPLTLLIQIQSHFSSGVCIGFQLMLGLCGNLWNLLALQV